MVVECFGTPGAGKSIVTRKLAESFGAPIIPMYVSKWYTLWFVVLHPWFVMRWVLHLVVHTAVTKSWHLFLFKLSVFQNTLGRVQRANQLEREHAMIFLDEGIAQRLLSLFETKTDAAICRKFIASMPSKTTIISICYKGTEFTGSKVGQAMRSRQSAEYQRVWQDTMEHNYVVAAEVLPQYFMVVPYTRTETDSDFETLVNNLKSVLV